VRDVGLGLGAALAVVPWVYVLQWGLTAALPESISPDPITLVPFAVVLGLLYYRTHRIVPSIVLHMALNATSLALAWSVLPPTGQ
jgi:membrane protease YdiL (CAAX protease family)